MPITQREFNRLQQDFDTEISQWVEGINREHLISDNELSALIEISTEELMERLKRSPMGQELLKKLGNDAESIFDQLGRRYELLGEKFTKIFRKRSRKWSTGVALILALVVNIDSVFMLDTYLKSSGIQQNIITQKDTLVQDYNNLLETLETEEGKATITAEEFKQAFRDSQQELRDLTETGLPLGWSYFPHVGIYHPESPDFQKRNTIGGWSMWILGVGLTSVLAGLGAPFWYDVITGISRVAQKARTIQGQSSQLPRS